MKKIFILGNKESTKNYYNAIVQSGAQVVYGYDIGDAFACDGLLLPGGADVNPQIYGEENTASEDINNDRDAHEIELIRYFSERNKPILGICRGIQVINVTFGGTLIQHVEHADKHSRCGESFDKIHKIKLNGHSFLSALYGNDFLVNSAHHQAVKIPATNLRIVAYSDDGIVEAMVHNEKPIISVQFHPERMTLEYKREDVADGKLIFDYFISLMA